MEESQELDIGRYLRLLYKRRLLFVATVIPVITLIITASYLMPKVYEAKSIIFIEQGLISGLMKDVAVTQPVEERTKALAVVMESRSMILRVLNDLGIDMSKKSDKEVEKVVKWFQKSTDIKVGADGGAMDVDLFTVSFKSSDPKLASNYVNALVKRYVEENLTTKKESAYGANQFLSEQISTFKNKIDSLEAAIGKASEDKRTVLEGQLDRKKKRLNDLLVQYTENHPEVIKVRAEIDQLKNELKDQSGRNSPVPGSEEGGNARNPRVSGEAAGRGDSVGRRTLPDMERELATYKKIYADLLATLGKSEVSTQVAVQDKAGSFKIVDPAIVPTIPVSPNRVKMILLALFGGIGAGFGAIVLADMLDRSIKSVDQLRTFGLPVLAVIPAIRTAKESRRKKTKDVVLYTVAGVYFACVLGIFMTEYLGLPYIDNFVQETVAGIKTSVKGVL